MTEFRAATWMETLSSPRVFIATSLLLALFNAYHFFALPACFTYDSFEYVRLADLLGSPRFEAEYYYARPPTYPLLLRGSFELFGRNSLAAQLPGTVLGFTGVLLIGLLLRRWKFPLLALAAMLLISISPDFLAYQHTVLTEAGSFFFLTLALFALLFPRNFSWREALLLSLALGACYYQRPTLLYLTPVFAVLAFMRWRETNAVAGLGRPFAGASLVLVLPFLIAYPWSRIVSEKPVYKDVGRMVISLGILKGVLFPPEDPIMANHKDNYIKAIMDSSASGRLDAAGLTQVSLIHFQWNFINEHTHDAGSVLVAGARKYPWRYIKGVGRCMAYFMGRSSADDEIMNSVRNIAGKDATGTSLRETGHPSFPIESKNFSREIGRSFYARIVNATAAPLRWVLTAGSVMTCIGFIVSLVRRDTRLFSVAAIPLALMMSHAIVLLSVNRYVFPAMPLLWLNLLLVPALLRRSVAASATSRSASMRTSPRLPAA